MTPATGPFRNRNISWRNAFADWAHAPARMVFEGSDRTPPLVTVAITTYKRYDDIVEAVQSVLDQDFDRPIEIIIVDNDPDTPGVALLLNNLPQLKSSNFRYFVNSQNVGLFPNHSRCIELARGPWMSILNDDDTLDANYMTLMFAELDSHPEYDGIIARKRWFTDPPADAEEGGAEAPVPVPVGWVRRLGQAVLPAGSLHGQVARVPFKAARAARAWMTAWLFRYKFNHWYGEEKSRRITPDKFFWGPIVGNVGGFTFRTEAGRAIGGFYPEEGGAADLWFFLRFASRFHLRQYRLRAANIRYGGNASASSQVLISGLEKFSILQQSQIGTDVPRWWKHVRPLVFERLRLELANGWKVDIPKDHMEKLIGIRLPKDRPRLLSVLRFMMKGSYPDAL